MPHRLLGRDDKGPQRRAPGGKSLNPGKGYQNGYRQGDREPFKGQAEERWGGKTIRQRLTEALMDREMTAHELSREVGIREREVVMHLPHIARSVASEGKELVVGWPRCLKCGFIFKNRSRFTRPGRCPRCRETHIESPRYAIRSR